MKRFLFYLVLAFFVICASNAQSLTFEISKDVHDSAQIPFISHSGSGAFDSYLILDLPFAPVRKLYLDFQKRVAISLKNRGEAHITVITPVEYYNVLRNHISIKEIDQIAKEMKIQSSSFTIVCIGRGEAVLNGRKEYTFYIVAQSEDLLKIRRKIKEVYVFRGGDPNSFDSEHYCPHITLGFTERDLHESDGVIKDKSSFFAYLIEKDSLEKEN